MDINPFKNLNFDRWVNVLLVATFIIFSYALLFPVQILTNELIALSSLGVFFILLSRMAMTFIRLHQKQNIVIEKHFYRPTISGFVLLSVGVLLIITAFWRFFF
ncbi:putative membrane protein [Campylobacter iguaniorum]|uniref:hypothetical protein n=1 Tax=Campylobacter iguaniorum TaxID=1244531 RepID=UPI00073A1E95|nr:hypothetical protein [Campylobacter iguaniorum]ALV25059.1 putative membrane protein [Campylobacter iguaniorum]